MGHQKVVKGGRMLDKAGGGQGIMNYRAVHSVLDNHVNTSLDASSTGMMLNDSNLIGISAQDGNNLLGNKAINATTKAKS